MKIRRTIARSNTNDHLRVGTNQVEQVSGAPGSPSTKSLQEYSTQNARNFSIFASEEFATRASGQPEGTGAAGWRTLDPTGPAPHDFPLARRDLGTREIYALDWEAP